ncbi:MAG: MBL fold metallo-hydrolase [Limisphaerales bacterium]
MIQSPFMHAQTDIKVTLHGAAGGHVTGSAYVLDTGKARVLIDFGMFQGGRRAEELNILPGNLDVRKLDAVLLTHAHLDHTGRLPLLTKGGYQGPIHATPATIDLTGLILRDSAKVQAQDMERTNRKLQRAGKPIESTLYSAEEVEAVLGQLKRVQYQQPVEVAPGIRACFVEAGHILGSASIQLEITVGSSTRRVVFSGDLGPKGIPILRDYEPFARADAVFLESTYGDRDHRPFRETVDEFVSATKQAVERRGKILVPTFAVGRAQLMLVLLAWMFRRRMVEPFPVFLDSPMAQEASRIYARHPELYDDEMKEFLADKPIEADLATLKLTATAEESKAINDWPGPCLVLAGAGMCNAGRILHHLRQNLWRPETSVFFVGYQAEGSLGRRLVEGTDQVKIFGETVAVRGAVRTLGGLSAHAGQRDLLEWFSCMASSRPKVWLTHGEVRGREGLASVLRGRHQIECALPGLNETVTI